MRDNPLRDKVFDLLKGFHGEDDLNSLFQLLGYEFVRRSDSHVSRNDWTEDAKNVLAESPRKVFRAGLDGEFGIVYCRLKGEKLLVGHERRVISQLQNKNNFDRGLFVFSTESQDQWHFVNVRYEADEKRRTLQRRMKIGPEERYRTISERIANEMKLEGDEASRLSDLEIQNKHNEAFDVEQVTKDFFKDYTQVYYDLQEDLIDQTGDARWAHDYSLQFINRMMFLYFVQRKRWLGDDPEFMRKFWDAYKLSDRPEDSFFEDWLKVLFFESFNGRFHGGYRYFPQDIQSVLQMAPYLNGGLFSENDLDRQCSFEISDDRFKTILDLLEHYNFTISEDSPLDQEVAVDPEMIGKVYESLVNVEETSADERSAAGIFYTPRTEIDLMCRLTVVDHLANHLGDERKTLLYEVVFAIEPDDKDEVDERITDEGLWEELDERLQSITTVDPACGSGSFLVGMLQVLDDLQERAARQLGREEDPYERRKRIIGQSLYGVDVMDWAVRVAELRLWLSLIVDTDFTRDELHLREEPLLPYFTFKLRPGDGLVQEVGGVNLGHMRSDFLSLSLSSLKRKVKCLKTEKLKFYNNDPDRKFKTAGSLEDEERRLFIEILDTRRHEMQNKIADLNQRIANPAEELTLEGMAAPGSRQLDLQTAALQKEVDGLEEERDRLDLARKAIRPDKPVPFVWDIAFVEIFEGEDRGFDIVVGNPPYVRTQNIADPRLSPEEVTTENKKEYKAKLVRAVYQTYPEFFGYNPVKDSSAHKFNGKSDLYIYFYFHGLSLLNQKGSFCFITSNSWLDVGYGKDLQEFLLRHCHVKMVLDSVKRVFASADVNTVITLFAPPERKIDPSKRSAKFILFKLPFEQALHPVFFEEIEAAKELTTTAESRIQAISQQDLLIDGAEKFGEDDIGGKEYVSNKWGGKFFRAPDILPVLMEKGRGILKPLSELVSIDSYLILPKKADKVLILGRNDVPQSLRSYFKPFVRSPKYFETPWIEDSPHRVLICTAAESRKDEELQVFIEEAASDLANEYKAKPKKTDWFVIKQAPAPILCQRRFGERHLILYNPDQFPSYDFYRLFPRDQEQSMLLAGAMMTTPFWMFKELFGRANLGEGALKVEGIDLKRMYVLDPSSLPLEVEELSQSILERSPAPLHEEVRKTDRLMLDEIIFDALDLTQGERDAVYESVINLVENRVNKASSLNQRGS
jgi:hypothetical protein